MSLVSYGDLQEIELAINTIGEAMRDSDTALGWIREGVKDFLTPDFIYKDGYAGINADAAEIISTALKTYINNVIGSLRAFKPNNDIDKIFKGPVAEGVNVYFNGVRLYMLSSIGLFVLANKDMERVRDNYRKGISNISRSVNNMGEDISKAINSIRAKSGNINLDE